MPRRLELSIVMEMLDLSMVLNSLSKLDPASSRSLPSVVQPKIKMKQNQPTKTKLIFRKSVFSTPGPQLFPPGPIDFGTHKRQLSAGPFKPGLVEMVNQSSQCAGVGGTPWQCNC